MCNKEKNHYIKTDQQLTQMLELAEIDVKTVIITAFCTFKKVEERLNMLNRGIKDFFSKIHIELL